MRLKNFSHCETTELEQLIRFALEGIACSTVNFEVRNRSSAAYSGRIWYRKRYRRGRNGILKEREHVRILIRVNRFAHFPVSNDSSSRRWIRTTLTPEQLNAQALHWRSVRKVSPQGVEQHLEYLEILHHPYGGQSSPRITINDWREAIVMVAAHEGKHLVQYRNKIPRSEVDCEAFALKKLIQYRSSTLVEIQAMAAHSAPTSQGGL